MRQLVWLHTAPEVKVGDQTKPGQESRFRALGEKAEMPENPAPYLTEWLFDAGPLGQGGDPVGWRDLIAWQEGVGIVLEPWEGRLIRRMSQDYAFMRFRAEKADCAAPYQRDRPPEEARDKVSDQFAAMIGALRHAGNGDNRST